MQYESHPASDFRYIVRKRNTDAQPDMGDDDILLFPAHEVGAEEKKFLSTFCEQTRVKVCNIIGPKKTSLRDEQLLNHELITTFYLCFFIPEF